MNTAQLMPSASPTGSRDPWECITMKLPQYFDVPTATGSLKEALGSYGSEMIKTCTGKPIERISCPFPEKSQWCGFSTAAPTSVMGAYSSYGSVASSWWAARSSSASLLASMCSHGWYKASTNHPANQALLNETIILGECHAEAYPTWNSLTTTSAAMTRATATTNSPRATKTNAARTRYNQAESAGGWMILSMQLVIRAMNAAL